MHNIFIRNKAAGYFEDRFTSSLLRTIEPYLARAFARPRGDMMQSIIVASDKKRED